MGTFGGEVSSIKFFMGKNNSIDENGLFSESIFGPIKDFRCKCGKLSLEVYDSGRVCDKCGVICGPSDLRIKTFGKISLVFPVIKPTKKKHFKKIVGTNHKHLLDPKKADALAVTSRYLAVSLTADNLKIVDTMSPLLGYFVVPIRITGLYSFIFSLRYVAEILNLDIAKRLFEDQYIVDIIKVLPPDIRPVVKDPKKKGEYRYVEINDYYIGLINQNNLNAVSKYISKLKEKDWFDKMRYNLSNNIVDELVDPMIPEFDAATARYQYYVDLIYDYVYTSISGKTGFIRSSILGKTIEFSARSVIVIDPSIEPYKVKVSRKILYKLWFPYFLYYLSKYKGEKYSVLFDTFTQFENYDLYKDVFGEFLSWFCSDQTEKRKEIEADDDMSETLKTLIYRRKIELENSEDTFD